MERSPSAVARSIRLAREGGAEALSELLGAYRNYLRFLACTSLDPALRGKVDASDVVQETLLQAFQDFPQFRGATEAEWLGWVRRILAHRLVDFQRRYACLRREAARERSLDVTLDRSSLFLRDLVAARGPSPSEAAQEHEQTLLVADALADLEADDREVLVLRSFWDLDWNEVGRRMARSPDSARMLWTRALARVGTVLGERLP